ncbi:MAG: ferrous iron transport protein B, partial [Legionellales bacterium]
MTEKKIALIGNPNCGKTTIYNKLTGLSAREGNYSGVTLISEVGKWQTNDLGTVSVTDYPGTYSLHAYKQEVNNTGVYQSLLNGEYDLIVNVVDAISLERHLYLTYQLLERELPLIVVVNRMDLARKHGLDIDIPKLEQLLGCTVVPMIACCEKDFTALEKTIESYTPKSFKGYPQSKFWRYLGSQLKAVGLTQPPHSYLYAVESGQYIDSFDQAELEHPLHVEIADLRYQQIQYVLSECQITRETSSSVNTRAIDKVVLHPIFGIPIFLLVMYGLFALTVQLGGTFQILVDALSHAVFVDGIYQSLNYIGLPQWFANFVGRGVGQGLATTMTFTPVLFCMFFCLGWLEHSGYMSRAAFLMDHLMRKIGLPGRSLVSFVIGFGCNVPGVLSTRVLARPQERLMSIMMSPFMSCGARLTLYAVMVTAFFPHSGHHVIFALYLIGIFAAVLTAILLQPSLELEQPLPLIMEMPAYQWPNMSILVRSSVRQVVHFIEKAARYIIPLSAILTLLMHFDVTFSFVEGGQMEHSVLAQLARMITVIFIPMGLTVDNWQATVGLIAGFLAKEVVVGTMNTLYAQITVPSEPIMQQVTEGLRLFGESLTHPIVDINLGTSNFHHTAYHEMMVRFGSTESAFAFLVFALLYFPCMSTIAAIS